MEKMTVKAYREMMGLDKLIKKDSKYHNKKVTYYGIEFDSMKEGARYLQLKTWEDEGYISELKLQPKFILQEAFMDHAGVKHQQITYKADFRYIKTNEIIIEDVKASANYQTQVYRIKKKMLLYKYKNIVFEEVY